MDLIVLLAPELCKSIQQVIGFEHRWEVIDLNHVTKLIRVEADAHTHVDRVVIVNMLKGNCPCLVQVCLNLRGQTQNNCLQ